MFSDQKKYLHLVQITSDVICLALLYMLFIPLIAIAVTKGNFISVITQESASGPLFYKSGAYLGLSPIYILIPTTVFGLLRQYQGAIVPSLKIIYARSVILCVAACGTLLLLLSFFDIAVKDKYVITLISTGLLFVFLVINRMHLRYLVTKSDTHDNIIMHLLLVGSNAQSRSICNYIDTHPELGLRVTGFLTRHRNEIGSKISGKPVLGEVKQLQWVLHQHHVNCFVYTGDNNDVLFSHLLNSCAVMGIDFATLNQSCAEKILPEKPKTSVAQIGDITLYRYQFTYYRPRALFLKRVFDFSASLGFILASAPVWIVVPVLIKASSPGPVFYKQKRIGKHGKRFVLLKFRSMVENAEQMQEKLMHLNEMDGPAFKIKQDPRLTLIGRQLRRFSLDELPQLLNVFRGDISLIGPRPATVDEVAQYTPVYRKRLSVTQGITCIWQVSGRNDIKFDEWMKLDLIYINNRSTAQDIKILMKTVPAVLLKKGAY